MRRFLANLTKAIVIAAVALAVPISGQRVAVPPGPPPFLGPMTPESKPRFAGQVRIAGRIADPGTAVQAVAFRGPSMFTICAEGEVRSFADPDDATAFWYAAELEPSPECTNPDSRYDFYVNGVWGGAARYTFTPASRLRVVHLAVPEVALRTPTDSGIKLFWVYGTVKDLNGGAAPRGTKVTATSRGGRCSGTGTTEDVLWQPKGRDSRPFGALGFYWIAIPMGPCTNKQVIFDVKAGNSTLTRSSANVHSPAYGTAVSANAAIDR